VQNLLQFGVRDAKRPPISQLKAALGNLDRVKRVVKVLGMVNAVESFGEQPKVINGFSDLMVEVFGEAIAILAGDALLTLAFQTLAFVPVEPQRRLNILATIAQAAGTDRGMIGGQVADLEAEKKTPDVGTLEYIHRSKTAALIRASIVAGGIAGGATNEDVERLKCFGENIGWAFQVVDDILDVEESSAVLGKTAGKDQAQQKATYPALYGILQSRDIAADLAAKALSELDYYGERASRLRELAQFLVARRS